MRLIMADTRNKKILFALEYLEKNYDFRFHVDSCTTLYKEKNTAEDQFTFLNQYDFNTLYINLILESNFTLTKKDLTHVIDLLTMTPIFKA